MCTWRFYAEDYVIHLAKWPPHLCIFKYQCLATPMGIITYHLTGHKNAIIKTATSLIFYMVAQPDLLSYLFIHQYTFRTFSSPPLSTSWKQVVGTMGERYELLISQLALPCLSQAAIVAEVFLCPTLGRMQRDDRPTVLKKQSCRKANQCFIWRSSQFFPTFRE